MIPGSQPPATRMSPRQRARRAVIAVATSAVVAVAVATPMALRMGDTPGEAPAANVRSVPSTTTSPTTTPPATSSTTTAPATSTTTTVPVNILGETTIRQGD